MDEHLASLLGIDPDDPDAKRAHEDAEALMQLIQTLVAHRKSAKLTQKAVAADMETTQSAVSEFERQGGDPRLSTIMRYARAVGLKIYVKAHTDQEVAQPSSSWTQVAETEERVPSSPGRRKAA
ncbi:helix-turn-helix transcriptional regulator [Kitasatospora sp. NPDC086791]|uniref:helix-turn-helix domain-containing protein n=1 Tax=Kitasatospora sp. NPDC086791 TaxID=3155178 RepID=UPI00344168BE